MAFIAARKCCRPRRTRQQKNSFHSFGKQRAMTAPLHIAIDAMSGDRGPSISVPAAVAAAREFPDVRFTLTGRQADLERARAQLKSAQSEAEAQRRQRAVLDSQELQLRGAVELQKAALALAKTTIGYTKILAPEDGIVSERLVRPGQLVSPGTQVISLVQNNVWVQANFLENQIRGIQKGAAAEIRVDAIPGVLLHGRVEEVAPASGSQFALLPPDNATGNFTKVVQRVPVKIALEDSTFAATLRPGISVIATVRTRR